MEKYFKVTFHAELHKFALAFKTDSDIDLFWKKGQKIAQSSKIRLSKCQAIFSETLSISCNMVFDHANKTFKSKITKFQVILYTQKGNKKVGQVHFDVAPYLNTRSKQSKPFDLPLQKCPDPNARLSFSLTASIQHQIDPDTISNASGQTVNIENIVGAQQMGQSSVKQNKDVPTRDQAPPPPPHSSSSSSSSSIQPPRNPNMKKKTDTVRDIPTEDLNTAERIKHLESQNKKIKQKLKEKDRLAKQNDDLRRKIKNEEYDSTMLIREKIDNGRTEIQKLQGSIKKQILLEKEVKKIEEDIFKCKFQIMNSFNYANEAGGARILDEMQSACGLKES